MGKSDALSFFEIIEKVAVVGVGLVDNLLQVGGQLFSGRQFVCFVCCGIAGGLVLFLGLRFTPERHFGAVVRLLWKFKFRRPTRQKTMDKLNKNDTDY